MSGFSPPDFSTKRAAPAAEERSVQWSNWAGNQSVNARQMQRPTSTAEVASIVKRAAEDGHRVKAVGSGHSFTAIALTEDVIVDLGRLDQMLAVDRQHHQVSVGAGITLSRLNDQLANVGLAMTNLGDIAYQTLAGAISTGTHGTGLNFGGIAAQVLALEIVTGGGDVLRCSPDQNAEIFSCARVGLGALGIITEVTLQVEPAFNLHAVEGPQPIDQVLSGWLDEAIAHDHFEFFWIPGTQMAMTKRNRRTQEAARPPSKLAHVRDKIVFENLAFGAIIQLGRRRPQLIPKINHMIGRAASSTDYIDRSDRIFASPRWNKFVEMEWSIPVADVPVVLRKIEAAIAENEWKIMFPVEARVAGADDIALSTASGRDSGYVAVHVAKGREYRPYFEAVQAIMDDHEGRPHWGKMHFLTAADLAPRYPQWEAFQVVRRECDPDGRFVNDYTQRVLGTLPIDGTR